MEDCIPKIVCRCISAILLVALFILLSPILVFSLGVLIAVNTAPMIIAGLVIYAMYNAGYFDSYPILCWLGSIWFICMGIIGSALIVFVEFYQDN